ncbi:MAG: LamG-like jellyroll fold domain-containing protein [Woeseiaceae bacterium]
MVTPPPPPPTVTNLAIRFFGNGVAAPDLDRIKIRIDDPNNNNPGPPIDVGDDDLTIEFWLMANAGDNSAGAVTCGSNNNWISGNIVIDRDRFNQGRNYGLSIAGGVIVFGVFSANESFTVCGTSNVLDGQWHHIAVQRRFSDGELWVYVDGELDIQDTGPDGDISYPDDGVPGDFCGGPCINSDPFVVLGAEKHDAGPASPSYSGFIDELRFSTVLRYSSTFVVPGRFAPDADTAALFHFDEGSGTDIVDATTGNRSPGVLQFGGNPAGPVWEASTAPTGM